MSVFGVATSVIPTVLVLGDQLDRHRGALGARAPTDCRVLMIESGHKINSKPWHRQRLHMIISAMEHFAAELREDGFTVDYRIAPTMMAGIRAHCDDFDVERVLCTEPASWNATQLLERLGVEFVRDEHFMCHKDDFASWAEGRKSFKLEDFYRWQRTRLDILMDGDAPVEGRWNFDAENREPKPTDDRTWPTVERFELDAIDVAVLERLPATWGAEPSGVWPVTRAQALTRLDEFVESGIAVFGPHQDAMLSAEWKLAHSVLAASTNIGLIRPDEIVERAERAYREGAAPIASVEGFVRQIIGWREYVWGLYWLWMPEYRTENRLRAHRPIPPAFTGNAPTDMACLATVLGHVHDNAYGHHIERLMVLGNLALTAGIDPWEMTEWMWSGFADGAEWVMLPNVIGMALHADGGRMATKPYAAGGAYINRMSDSCAKCRYDPKKRTGDTACPFTTLYWDFLARNEAAFTGNHRMGQQLAGMRRLKDLDDTRVRAKEVLELLDRGDL